ncbi:dipeptide/oligopeptide/nickel ABC transporter permease/ATP-binding protein [Streptomyces sp. NPDC052013]|uniref:dipeptide/oligopeptide/nickel ABC transporter permease/ATP-binding protein n=1 Tax=Streptomyces sp. NPDC052013 TaxID=3365679 RepID=UPI0037D1FA21
MNLKSRPEEVTAPPRPWRAMARQFLGNRLATGALIVLAAIVIACAAAPLLTGSGPNDTSLGEGLQGPSARHLLGTDQLGRDLLTRVLFGGRSTLLDALIVSLVAVGVAVPLGIVAGYVGGWADRVIATVTDIVLSLPAMIVMLVVMTAFSEHLPVAMAALGLILAPPIVRNVRGAALAVRNELFIDAAKVAGLSKGRIVFRHVFPRVLGPILVQAALATALGLQFAVGLSFLGFGAQPPSPDWGSMISEGSHVLNSSPWPLLAGGIALGLVSLTLVLVGDGLRDMAVESWTGSPSRRRRRPARPPVPVSQAPRSQDRPETEEPLPDEALLVVRGLSVAFTTGGTERKVVSDLNLTIAPGEIVGIVGESGCGKSSVSRAVSRLLASGGEIVGGSIRFADKDVASLKGKDLYQYRRHSVSYIAQDPMTALDPSLRVGVLLRRIVQAGDGLSRRAADARVLELLAQVQLPDPAAVAKRYPHELSGGMAQRVGIARAIATKPRLLIADEPTTALDVTVQAEILGLLRALQQQLGMAVLLVSHDWGVVARICDRVVVMYGGEVVERGRLEKVAREPAHPYTAALLACRPSSVVDDDLPLPTIRGSVLSPGEWPTGCRFAARCTHRTESCDAAPIPVSAVASAHDVRCIHPLRDGDSTEVTADV